jgi:hypothetical protein
MGKKYLKKKYMGKRDGLGPAQYFVSKRVFFPRAELFFRVLCYTRFGPIPGFQMGPVEFACMPREPMCSQLTIATEYIGIAAMERRYYCTRLSRQLSRPSRCSIPTPCNCENFFPSSPFPGIFDHLPRFS